MGPLPFLGLLRSWNGLAVPDRGGSLYPLTRRFRGEIRLASSQGAPVGLRLMRRSSMPMIGTRNR